MRSVLLSIILISLSNFCRAQYVSIDKPKYKTVRQDTINIKGIVYDAQDKPAIYLQIKSANKEMVFSGLNINTTTDSTGKFELKGALPNDILNIFWGKSINIINNGSRYIEIHLPPLKQDTETNMPVELTAKRQVKKGPTPVFKVITNANVNDYYGIYLNIYIPAKLRDGQKKFNDYIRSQINYPQKAIENNIEGEVEIGFTIENNGPLTNYHIIRGIGYGCEEEVIRALKKCYGWRWRPAYENQHRVASRSSVKVNFKLTDK